MTTKPIARLAALALLSASRLIAALSAANAEPSRVPSLDEMAGDWMRAMSQRDAAAANSDRPDHGPMGPYDGWIPLTVGTMWRLGFPRDASEFYCRVAMVTKEGPFAQAREFFGPNRAAYDAPVRVAERDGCMKECISGAAFTDVALNTFFGFNPALDGKALLTDPKTPRPFTGKLLHVRTPAGVATITGGENGLEM